MTIDPFTIPMQTSATPCAAKPLTPNALIATARGRVDANFTITSHGDIGELSNGALILKLACALEESQAQLVEALANAAPAGVSYGTGHITTMLNNACDEIQELDSGNELIDDVTNLLVNASLHYLSRPGDELIDVVVANYDGHFRCDEDCDDQCGDVSLDDNPLYRIQTAG